LLHKDGSSRWVENVIVNLLSEPSVQAVVMHLRDKTERIRADQAERALRQAQHELAHVTRVTTMGELAASIAHEVSQPIAAAHNNASAALRFLDRESPDLEEVREALSSIVDNAAHAGDVISRIRDHLKKDPPRKDRVDLNAAINEVIALTRSEVSAKPR
jgi:C4-dicarboxylate-specific signal transduction histidine kinase